MFSLPSVAEQAPGILATIWALPRAVMCGLNSRRFRSDVYFLIRATNCLEVAVSPFSSLAPFEKLKDDEKDHEENDQDFPTFQR
jgi:hypothetical protein